MPKHQKALARLCATPPPANFKWSELKAVLEHLGYRTRLTMVDLLRYNGYEGTAELDMTRRVCRGRILFIDDLVTYEAKAPDLLQKEFEAAVDDYIETCAQVGKAPQRPFKGLFNVRVPSALHRAAALRAARDGVALNEVVVKALAMYLERSRQREHHREPMLAP